MQMLPVPHNHVPRFRAGFVVADAYPSDGVTNEQEDHHQHVDKSMSIMEKKRESVT